jgi:TatD DNase family protein
MEYFESHAHYDDERFDGDRNELLTALPSLGVTKIINTACSIESITASIKLAEAFPYVYATVGVHPHDAKTLTDERLEWIAAQCSHEKVVAVGEIGLDFYYDHSPRDTQRHWFKRQLEIAARVGLPVAIHSRDAARETFDILAEWAAKRNGGLNGPGVIHSYSGSAQMALDYVKLGFYIGVGGVVTFDKTKKLPEAVEAVPLERLLIETDAPYLTPKPNRGKRNDSSNLKFIAEKIAEIKGVTPEEAAAATYRNACKLFGL